MTGATIQGHKHKRGNKKKKQWSLHWRSVKDSRTRFTGEHISPRGNEGRVHKSVAGKGKTNNRCDATNCGDLLPPSNLRGAGKRGTTRAQSSVAFGWSENITSTQNKCPCLQPCAGIRAEHERLFSALAHAIPTAQNVLCFPGLDASLPSFSYSCVRPSPALDILLNNTVGPDLLYPAFYHWRLNFKALKKNDLSGPLVSSWAQPMGRGR